MGFLQSDIAWVFWEKRACDEDWLGVSFRTRAVQGKEVEGAGGPQCLTEKTSAHPPGALELGERPSYLYVNPSLDVGWLHPGRA